MGGLTGYGVWEACSCNILKNPDYPWQRLIIAINNQLSSFFTLGKIAARLKNKSSRHCFPIKANRPQYKMPLIHFILRKVNFTPGGKNCPPLDENTPRRKRKFATNWFHWHCCLDFVAYLVHHPFNEHHRMTRNNWNKAWLEWESPSANQRRGLTWWGKCSTTYDTF